MWLGIPNAWPPSSDPKTQAQANAPNEYAQSADHPSQRDATPKLERALQAPKGNANHAELMNDRDKGNSEMKPSSGNIPTNEYPHAPSRPVVLEERQPHSRDA